MKSKTSKLRRCNNCGKEKVLCDTKCMVYKDGKRIYCGYMRVVRDE